MNWEQLSPADRAHVARRATATPPYAMKERCLNRGSKDFANYGGRGIKVCARWLESFENFLLDMGARPDGFTIDRIDNNGNYEPGNCRWATREEQVNNRRNNKFLTSRGTTKTTAAWSRALGMRWDALNLRVMKGESVEGIIAAQAHEAKVFSFMGDLDLAALVATCPIERVDALRGFIVRRERFCRHISHNQACQHTGDRDTRQSNRGIILPSEERTQNNVQQYRSKQHASQD